MKRNAALPVAIIMCLLVVSALTSCCEREPRETPETDAEQESGTIGRVEHETIVTSGDLELKAVVTVPARKAGELVPGAVIVHAAGPIGRDGFFRQMGITFTAYKDLAEQLAERGIATIRYDKRIMLPYGRELNSVTFTLEDLYPDALAALERLRATDGVDPERLYFIGHGEGAVVVPALLEANPGLDVRGLVLIAPPLMAYDDLLIRADRLQIRQIDLHIRMNPGVASQRRQERAVLQQHLDTFTAAFKLLDEGGWEESYVLEMFREAFWRHAIDLYAGNLDRIKRLELPILIMQGNGDRAVLAQDLLDKRAELEATGHITIYLQDAATHFLINPATHHVHRAATDTIAAWLHNPAAPLPPPDEEPPAETGTEGDS